MSTNGPITEIGIVVIGRNEGHRLTECLGSIAHQGFPIVYVDSGSTDDSVGNATAAGCTVIELDASKPFTAARGRNQGFHHFEQVGSVKYIQFIDGDCELNDTWLPIGTQHLNTNPQVAAVAGALIEKHPEASLYNKLCQFEWDSPGGEVNAVGGIAMYRKQALADVGLFREDLIAGEEPELCLRLQSKGHKIMKLDHDMAHHDAAITRFSQWWKRSVRCGHAFAQGNFIHHKVFPGYRKKECISALFWGFVLPIAIIIGYILHPTFGALGMALYPLQVVRMSMSDQQEFRDAIIKSSFIVCGKFAEFSGAAKFYFGLLTGRASQLIEYK